MVTPAGEDASDASRLRKRDGQDRATLALSITISTAAVVLIIAHIWFPQAKLDAITLAFLAVGIAPWLGRIFQSISGPGGWRFEWRKGIEYRLMEQKEQLRQQQSNAERIEQVASAAKTQARDALLASRYHQARIDFRSQSKERETAMRTIWLDMVAELTRVQDFDVAAHLNSKDDGLRLAGYAYLYANPDNRWRDELLAALARERKGFNEEMGLRVLQLLLGLAATASTMN